MTSRKGANKNDTWLTPPLLLEALGRFDLDPCCSFRMPWKTARRMICLPRDGLKERWVGRVWCNPPYSDPLPWVEKMASHDNGIMLLPAKSFETRWGQRSLETMGSIFVFKGRLSFYRGDGTLSGGEMVFPLFGCVRG